VRGAAQQRLRHEVRVDDVLVVLDARLELLQVHPETAFIDPLMPMHRVRTVPG
jgi:hypothetical protein